jgi:hypothetical protein
MTPSLQDGEQPGTTQAARYIMSGAACRLDLKGRGAM